MSSALRTSIILLFCVTAGGPALLACHARPKAWSVEEANPETTRTTTLGELIGGDGRFDSHAWLGIPFAAPPVGDLRWRAPRPPAPWLGTRPALSFGPDCPQPAGPLGNDSAPAGEIVGDEDCLYLNIWSPRFTPAEVPRGAARLPVMFWIHGGGNSIGTASAYEGGHLATAGNVIVVTTQYRLGPLGWFRHRALGGDAADASGNYGTLDLIRGLAWVRDNIAAFGGDPGNVTIFGESAGGQNVYSLLVSPAAKGLFQRAIVESGYLPQTTVAQAEHFRDDPLPGDRNSSNEIISRLVIDEGLAPDRVTAKVRLAAMSDQDLAAWLRGMPAWRLFTAFEGKPFLGMIPMPLVINDGTVLPEDWLGHLGRPDGWNVVPTLVGTNRDEVKLHMFLNPAFINRRLGVFPRFAVRKPVYEAFAEALSHAWKATAADAPADAMHRSGEADVFVYRFDWHGEPRVAGADLSAMLGAAHGIELPFVFGFFELGALTKALNGEASASERMALSDAMMSYWSQFARTGRPDAGNANNLPRWPAWGDVPQYLVLDSASEGGIRTSGEVRSMARVIADIDADPRIPAQIDKCRVFHELVGWINGLSQTGYEHAGQHGCAAFPFDGFPWDEKK